MVKIRLWNRGPKSRLYVEDDDGRPLGHVDPNGDTPAERVMVHEKSVNPDADRARITLAVTQMVGAAPAPAITQHPWRDLATNQPGDTIAHKVEPGNSYEAGLIGEQRTAGVLSPLMNHGWKVLHSVPIGANKDADHLLIGPVGVLMLNSKATTYPVRVNADGTVSVDGYERAWIDSTTRDAELASRALSAACRERVAVFGVVVVWSPKITGADKRLMAPSDLLSHLASAQQRFDRTWVDQVFAQARRSDTWERLR